MKLLGTAILTLIISFPLLGEEHPREVLQQDFWHWSRETLQLRLLAIDDAARLLHADEIIRETKAGGFGVGFVTTIAANTEKQEAIVEFTMPRRDKSGRHYMKIQSLSLPWKKYQDYKEALAQTGIWGVKSVSPKQQGFEGGFSDSSGVILEKMTAGVYTRITRVQVQLESTEKQVSDAYQVFYEVYCNAYGIDPSPFGFSSKDTKARLRE